MLQLEVACKAYHQESLDEDGDTDDEVDGDEDCAVSPKDVGHNIYILIHQLALYNKDLGRILQPDGSAAMDPKLKEALSFYQNHTAQIEVVRQDNNLEQIVFPIPEICEYLTELTKFEVREHSEVDEQGSKVTDFFAKTEDMYEEMKWQKKLRKNYQKLKKQLMRLSGILVMQLDMLKIYNQNWKEQKMVKVLILMRMN